jgi:LysR family glycine cleavage system transcriptional activator
MRFPGYECKAVLDDFRLPVCSPETLARHPIGSYEDLAHHTLLCHDNFAGTFTGMWDRWLSLAGVDEKMQPARLHFEKFYVALRAANEGLGLVLAPIRLVSSDLHKGRLVAPFREPAVACNPVEMLFPGPPNDSSRTNAFVGWVFEQAVADVVDIGQWRDNSSIDHGPSHD